MNLRFPVLMSNAHEEEGSMRKALIQFGLATAGLAAAIGLTAAPVNAAPSPQSVPVTVAERADFAAQAQGWVWVNRWNVTFSAYGGPSSIGWTADESIYLYCQQDGIWGWWTYAWVPSLNSWGWLRNGDITGYTNPIAGLDYC